jgi:hypothetical protein
MWPFVADLFYRGLEKALANGSSTRISVLWLGFGVLSLGFIFTAGIEWITGGRNMAALITALKSWKSWAGAAMALLVGWVLLLIYSTLNVAYQDHQKMVAWAAKTCVTEAQGEPKVTPLIAERSGLKEPLKVETHIKQSGSGNTANPGTVTAPLKQEPCSVAQIGGSGNHASVDCAPPVRVSASAQIRQQTGDPNAPWATSFTIHTNALVQTGDLRLKCSGPVLRAGISRINPMILITGRNGPDTNDPNTVVYELSPEMLSPGKVVTIAVYSKEPVMVLSGTIGQQEIVF